MRAFINLCMKHWVYLVLFSSIVIKIAYDLAPKAYDKFHANCSADLASDENSSAVLRLGLTEANFIQNFDRCSDGGCSLFLGFVPVNVGYQSVKRCLGFGEPIVTDINFDIQVSDHRKEFDGIVSFLKADPTLSVTDAFECKIFTMDTAKKSDVPSEEICSVHFRNRPQSFSVYTRHSGGVEDLSSVRYRTMTSEPFVDVAGSLEGCFGTCIGREARRYSFEEEDDFYRWIPSVSVSINMRP